METNVEGLLCSNSTINTVMFEWHCLGELNVPMAQSLSAWARPSPSLLAGAQCCLHLLFALLPS